MSLVRKFENSSDMPAPDGHESNGPPPPKKKFINEPRLLSVSSSETLDLEVLKFQHGKLKTRLEQRQKTEQALLERIEQLENRQTKDDAVLNVINRYWNQLNEDVRILLQRFDSETSDETENQNEDESTTSFLTQLATWDKDELDSKLANRVQVSTRAVAKVIQAFDRLQQRSIRITDILAGNSDISLSQVIKERNQILEAENLRMHSFNTSLHEKHRAASLRAKEMEEKFTSEETKADEYKNQVDDLNWEVAKLSETKDKLEAQLYDQADKMRRHKEVCDMGGKRESDVPLRKLGVSEVEIIDLRKEAEEYRELASNRLIELNKLHQTQKETLEELEKLRMDLRTLPDSVIMETTEYKSLQSKFSLVYNDSLEMRQALDNTKRQLSKLSSAHLKTTEQLEAEELLGQKKLRTELIQQEDLLCQVRKEYEMLRIEFETNIVANEQVTPISREMRTLLTSLQTHNHQLKGELARQKKKLQQALTDVAELKKEKVELTTKLQALQIEKRPENDVSGVDGYKEEEELRPEAASPGDDCLIVDPNSKAPSRLQQLADEIKDLKQQLKQSQLSQKETRLLLDMHKSVSKEDRDKAHLMAAEKKLRIELDAAKAFIHKLQESQKEDKKKLAEDEALHKIKNLEDRVADLLGQVSAQKSEQEACFAEMEVTGQGFEDMQEQNSRLIQQLKEKDDANFKLMSDKIKSSQILKLTREEVDHLKAQIEKLGREIEAQNQVVRKLEEMEKHLVNTLAIHEKEARLRITSAENNKRKAIESAQSATELRLHLEKYHSQMKEAQQTVAEKTSALEAESFKARRFQEQIAALNRKVERLNRIEMAGNTDAVMLEEIREYKESLTCPSCKVKRKDAVLTKCFHVFCFDCLRTRYETRQRKCPKCNAAFGANDYHRLYLT